MKVERMQSLLPPLQEYDRETRDLATSRERVLEAVRSATDADGNVNLRDGNLARALSSYRFELTDVSRCDCNQDRMELARLLEASIEFGEWVDQQPSDARTVYDNVDSVAGGQRDGFVTIEEHMLYFRTIADDPTTKDEYNRAFLARGQVGVRLRPKSD
ncbi:MAG: hypothetical protein AAF219_09075 [Myxococcota bacterium]